MTKDEALKLALEALENISTALREDDVLGSDIELMLNAITAIRETLAQPVQEPMQDENAIRADERRAIADDLEYGFIDDEGHHIQYAKEIRARGQA